MSLVERGFAERKGRYQPPDEESEPPPITSGSGPLAGVRVIDCSNMFAGPLACQILGDFGAEVIKIEHPSLGDSLRGHGPAKDGIGLWWKMVARNKRCVGLDLGDPEGAAIFKRLLGTADVLVESFRPRTLERWGISPTEVTDANPRLVVVRVSGFGQDGPYSDRPAFGTLIEAMSGFALMTGEADGPPTLPPFGLADGIAGISAALSAVMALYYRDARGRTGQVVDLAILEPLITVLGPQAMAYDQLGKIPVRVGNRSLNNSPRNTYRTADGHWVAVSTSTTNVAERVMHLVGHPEVTNEPWFATGLGRAQHADLLDPMVATWVGERKRSEVLALFEEAKAAAAPVYDVAELMEDPQVRHRKIFEPVDDADLGPIAMQNVLFRMSETPGSVRFTGRRLGTDTEAVLCTELGIPVADLDRLRERGTVG